MGRVLVTGMSGTGKSTALVELAHRGFRVVDTDSTAWSRWIPESPGTEGECLWREDRIAELLAADKEGTLYVSGCMSNQGKSDGSGCGAISQWRMLMAGQYAHSAPCSGVLLAG